MKGCERKSDVKTEGPFGSRTDEGQYIAKEHFFLQKAREDSLCQVMEQETCWIETPTSS